MVRKVRVVQPEIVFGAGQGPRELNFVANVPGGNCRVRLRITEGRTIVQPVGGPIVEAGIVGYTNG